MKRIIAILTLCAAVFGLTACSRSSGDESASSGGLPINTSNALADASTSYFDIKKPSGNTSNTSFAGFDNIDLSDLVPENGARLDDLNPLGEFTVNAVPFNIADDITPNDIAEQVGGNFGNWGMGYHDYQWTNTKSGYSFYGAGFNHANGGAYVYIEATDANGLVTEWRKMTTEGELTYDDYSVKGIRFNKQDIMSNLVVFTAGLTVGETPQYYEDLLGRGYVIEDESGDAYYTHWRVVIYKTSTATMVLEFRKNDYKAWYNESITLIKN